MSLTLRFETFGLAPIERARIGAAPDVGGCANRRSDLLVFVIAHSCVALIERLRHRKLEDITRTRGCGYPKLGSAL